MTTDAELVAAAVDGGPEAFGPIIERYQDAVFGVALSRLRDFHDAECVAQDVFVEAFQRIGNLKDPSRLGAWLRSITIHRSIDRLRGRTNVVEIESPEVEKRSVSSWQAEEDRKDLREQVLAAIGRLSKTQRETTTLFYINGYSVQEVAAIQEVPVGTVTYRLHAAREKLKEEMIGVVENVLRSETPKEDFAARVCDLLSGRVHVSSHDEFVAELRRIGMEGFEGFVRAASSPRWQTRRTTMKMLDATDYDVEAVIRSLTGAARDPNKKVRRHTAFLVLLDVSEERKRKEFLPLVLPLLSDHSARVRSTTAWILGGTGRAALVPLALAARTLLDETNLSALQAKKWLLRRVLEAHEAKAGT